MARSKRFSSTLHALNGETFCYWKECPLRVNSINGVIFTLGIQADKCTLRNFLSFFFGIGKPLMMSFFIFLISIIEEIVTNTVAIFAPFLVYFLFVAFPLRFSLFLLIHILPSCHVSIMIV